MIYSKQFWVYSKQFWASDTDYDPLDNSNISFRFRKDILNLLFSYYFFIFFHVKYKLRFGKATYLSFLLKFILSENLSNNIGGSIVLLHSEFLNIASILFYKGPSMKGVCTLWGKVQPKVHRRRWGRVFTQKRTSAWKKIHYICWNLLR